MSFDAQALSPLFELTPDAVLCVGQDRRILFANPSAELMLGARPGARAEDLLSDVVLSDPAERFVTAARLRGRDARISAVRVEGVSLYTIEFISERKENEISVHYGALKEMGSDLFSARLAIDAIVKSTGAEKDEKLRAYSGILYRSYYRMKRLQEHMALAIGLQGKRLPFNPRLTDLSALCLTLCDTAAALVRPMGIEIVFEAPEGDCRGFADHALMETLLLNLLSNSLLHTSAGDTVRVSLSRQDRRFVLAVDDPGEGISPLLLPKLFSSPPEADRTDTAAGAGLGLLIVRGIAELHGGALIMESRENAGTRIRVWLPQPDAEDLQKLCQPETPYRVDGLNTSLTELSVVLDTSWYDHRFFD